jgi:hypothetical protein
MKVHLHIERLILDGLPVERRDAPLVQASIEAEIARLLSTEGIAPSLLSGGAIYAQPASSISVTSETTPAELGAQIAQAVYGGLGK